MAVEWTTFKASCFWLAKREGNGPFSGRICMGACETLLAASRALGLNTFSLLPWLPGCCSWRGLGVITKACAAALVAAWVYTAWR